jgi:hypothetical protein
MILNHPGSLFQSATTPDVARCIGALGVSIRNDAHERRDEGRHEVSIRNDARASLRP